MASLRIPSSYRLTKKVASLLGTIEANKEVIESISLPLEVEENIRRQSLLGSALFSARIEGNTLTKADVEGFSKLPPRDRRKLEVSNLLRANSYVQEYFKLGKKITRSDFFNLHRMAMKGVLAPEFLGKFRSGHEGIFDIAGNIIYHAPPPSEVRALVDRLLDYANGKNERLVPIRAILSHLGVEMIHPFVDGSGRVGRLLQFAVLCTSGYGMKGFASIEENIDKNKQLYYWAIEHSQGGGDATPFVELMLEYLALCSQAAREKAIEKSRTTDVLDFLPPRRKELVQIIREHPHATLDFLHRRFLRVDPRLLRYDLKKLCDDGLVKKIGKTRGSVYRADS